jgi:hypothetical protein
MLVSPVGQECARREWIFIAERLRERQARGMAGGRGLRAGAK